MKRFLFIILSCFILSHLSAEIKSLPKSYFSNMDGLLSAFQCDTETELNSLIGDFNKKYVAPIDLGTYDKTTYFVIFTQRAYDISYGTWYSGFVFICKKGEPFSKGYYLTDK